MKTTPIALLALAASFSGCALGLQRGNARVTRTPRFLHIGELEGHEVAFPAVVLSRPGTTTFNFVHLPSDSYGYYYQVTGGSHRSDAQFHCGDRTLAQVHRPNAVVIVHAVSHDGKILFQEDVHIGNLDWHSGSAMTSLFPQPVSSATDFQLSVTVATPSTNLNEKIRVVGFTENKTIYPGGLIRFSGWNPESHILFPR